MGLINQVAENYNGLPVLDPIRTDQSVTKSMRKKRHFFRTTTHSRRLLKITTGQLTESLPYLVSSRNLPRTVSLRRRPVSRRSRGLERIDPKAELAELLDNPAIIPSLDWLTSGQHESVASERVESQTRIS
jgi:hypothetical protein